MYINQNVCKIYDRSDLTFFADHWLDLVRMFKAQGVKFLRGSDDSQLEDWMAEVFFEGSKEVRGKKKTVVAVIDDNLNAQAEKQFVKIVFIPV